MPDVLWSGHDGEGNTVTGRIPVTVTGAARTVPGAFGDGTNRTADLQAFIDATPDGSTIDFGSLNIRSDQTLKLYQRRNLTLVGASIYTDNLTGSDLTVQQVNALPKGDPRKNAARSRSHWLVMDCDGITFVRPKVRGPNTGWQQATTTYPIPDAAYLADLEGQHGFDGQFTRGLTLIDPDIDLVWGDHVCLAPNTVDGRWCEDVTITRPHFRRNGRQSISLTGARRVTVTDPWFHHLRRTCFDLEPAQSLGGSEDVLIQGGKTGKWDDAEGPAVPGQRLGWLSITNLGQTRRLTVRGHVARDLSIYARSQGRGEDFLIEDCRSLGAVTGDSAQKWAWGFVNVDRLTVRRNIVPLPGAGYTLVAASGCTGVDVKDNQVPTKWNGTAYVSDPNTPVTELRAS